MNVRAPARIDGLKVAKARLALPEENGRRVSQAALAERAGLHSVTVSNIERGAVTNTTLETIDRLARALRVEISDLIADDTQEAALAGDPFREGDGHRDLAARVAARASEDGVASLSEDAA